MSKTGGTRHESIRSSPLTENFTMTVDDASDVIAVVTKENKADHVGVDAKVALHCEHVDLISVFYTPGITRKTNVEEHVESKDSGHSTIDLTGESGTELVTESESCGILGESITMTDVDGNTLEEAMKNLT